MAELPMFLLIVALMLAVVHTRLPREPRLRQVGGRLSLRPPLPRLLGESTIAILALAGTVYIVAFLLAGRALLGAAVGACVMVWLTWRIWRRWHVAGVVFDRRADAIRQGPVAIGRVSEASGVRVTGQREPALEVYLRAGGRDTSGAGPAEGNAEGSGKLGLPASVWPVPGVDEVHAPVVGQAIADYLHVPLVTRIARSGASSRA